MSSYKPAQIFASISNQPPQELPKKKLGDSNKPPPSKRDNEIQVCATGELSVVPDRCSVTLTASSVKDHVGDAKNSVQRRLDYILQTLHNHQIKENDITVNKVLRRVDGVFHFDAEVTAQFYDFTKCQTISNFLVEKLDESVIVTPPKFTQSPARLENFRRQASLAAVKNAKQKAAEIGQLLQAKVGQALAIREEDVSEWEGPAEETFDTNASMTIQQRIVMATVHILVKVTATFELRSKTKSKQNES